MAWTYSILNAKGYLLLPTLIETMVRKTESPHTLTVSVIINMMPSDSFFPVKQPL